MTEFDNQKLTTLHMKKIALLLILSLPFSCFSQTCFKIGALSTYSNEKVSFGGEIGAYGTIGKKFTLGPTAQVIKFTNLKGIYVPVALSMGYMITSSLQLHTDHGYSMYNKNESIAGESVQITGSYFTGSGLKYNFGKENGLYLNLQYSLYNYRTKISGKTYKSNSDAVAFTIGWMIKE